MTRGSAARSPERWADTVGTARRRRVLRRHGSQRSLRVELPGAVWRPGGRSASSAALSPSSPCPGRLHGRGKQRARVLPHHVAPPTAASRGCPEGWGPPRPGHGPAPLRKGCASYFLQSTWWTVRYHPTIPLRAWSSTLWTSRCWRCRPSPRGKRDPADRGGGHGHGVPGKQVCRCPPRRCWKGRTRGPRNSTSRDVRPSPVPAQSHSGRPLAVRL